jgi:hypothetical protein
MRTVVCFLVIYFTIYKFVLLLSFSAIIIFWFLGNSKKPKYGKITHKNGPHIQNHFLKIKLWNCLK